MSFPIVFIFQGSKIPKYIEYSLKINSEFSDGNEIYFVSNVFPKVKTKGVMEIDIASFYESMFNNYLELIIYLLTSVDKNNLNFSFLNV